MSQEDDAKKARKREQELRRNGEKLLLTTFEARYGQEVAAEEDVFRTLPFFATALGVVVAACAYAGNRLPQLPDLLNYPAGIASLVMLGGVVVTALAVLIFLLRATWFHRFYRPGTEADLVNTLDAQVDFFAPDPEADPESVADGVRHNLIPVLADVIASNRAGRQDRLRFRAMAASCLVISLMLALAATTTIFIADRIGSLPRIAP